MTAVLKASQMPIMIYPKNHENLRSITASEAQYLAYKRKHG